MYLVASASVVIECPRARAFDYATNLTNFAEWFPAVVEVTSRDNVAPATVGKQYEETFVLPLRGRRSVAIRVIEVDPARRIVTEGALSLLRPRMEIDFKDAGFNACEVQWRMLSRNSALLARWTVLPLARQVMQKRADAAMRRLKNILEDKIAHLP